MSLYSWSFWFDYLTSNVSLQTGGLPVDKEVVRDVETFYANIPAFLHMKEMYSLFLQGGISCCCQAAMFSLTKSTSFFKDRPRKARPSRLTVQSAFHPHLLCVEDVMVRCYFPLALLLEITACDCDKWIFPLNSLVEWGIPLTIGTIPTQVKHWVIFFLWARSEGGKQRIDSNYHSYFLCCMHYDSRILQLFIINIWQAVS